MKTEPLGLIHYDAMCTAIAACCRVDEAAEIRRKARALEIYAKQALNTEAERRCGEIRLRAEHRAGELLKEMGRNGERHDGTSAGPGRGKKGVVRHDTFPKTLGELGITRDQSSKWQQLAGIPEGEFEAELAKPGPKPSTSGILAQHQQKTLPRIDPDALQAWGRIKDFERYHLLRRDPLWLLRGMTVPMKEDVLRLAPKLLEWLQKFGGFT